MRKWVWKTLNLQEFFAHIIFFPWVIIIVRKRMLTRPWQKFCNLTREHKFLALIRSLPNSFKMPIWIKITKKINNISYPFARMAIWNLRNCQNLIIYKNFKDFSTITFFSDHLDPNHFHNRFGWSVVFRISFFEAVLTRKKVNFGQKCQFYRKKSNFFVFRQLFFRWSLRVLNFFAMAYFGLFKRNKVDLRLFQHPKSNQTYSKHVFIPD